LIREWVALISWTSCISNSQTLEDAHSALLCGVQLHGVSYSCVICNIYIYIMVRDVFEVCFHYLAFHWCRKVIDHVTTNHQEPLFQLSPFPRSVWQSFDLGRAFIELRFTGCIILVTGAQVFSESHFRKCAPWHFPFLDSGIKIAFPEKHTRLHGIVRN